MKDIGDQLLAIGIDVNEEYMVVITLKFLPPSFENFVEILNITFEMTDTTFEKLCS